MLHNIIFHPSAAANAQAMIDNWKALSTTSQLVLCTLLQVRSEARKDTPLAEQLCGLARILGHVGQVASREDLSQATAEVYATLQTMAARERGDDCDLATYDTWFRDIS